LANKYHSIHAYAAFDEHLDKIERWLRPKIHPVLGGDTDTVHHRLIQRLVELTLVPFVSQLAQRLRNKEPFLPPPGAPLDLEGITIDTLSGRVGFSPGFLLCAGLDFARQWLHILFSILCIGTRTPRGKATLVFGVGTESLFYAEDDQRFVEYCRKGPITPLAKATRLIIQHGTRTGSCSDERVSYARHPFVQLACEVMMSRREQAILLGRHFLLPALYVRSAMRCRALALLSRDFALSPFLGALDKAGMIEAVVFTNSNYANQPMWARVRRRYETNMVWYSQNAHPFVMKGDHFSADLPNYRYMQVDAHWVWTDGFRQYLTERAGRMQRVEVVGPVMWCLPSDTNRHTASTFRIAVFDVTPFSEAYAESIGLLESYYSSTTAKCFLGDILQTAREISDAIGRKCTIRLKHKRHYSISHDRGYIEQVRDSVEQGEVELIPFDINIYEFLSQCDVAVVIPNSSPAYIASFLQIPSIYFDPTMAMQPNFETAPNIYFASGKDELKQRLLQFMGEWRSARDRACGNS